MPPIGPAVAPAEARPATVPFDPLRPTVFHQAWWLSAATDGDYREIEVKQSGRRVGYFPYVLRSVSGRHRLCGMPPATPVLGPAIDEGTGSACNRALRRAQTTRELLAQVPPGHAVQQRLHRGTVETLIYQELGYEASVRFSFEVTPAPGEVLWRTMRRPTRELIASEGARYRVRVLDDGAMLAVAHPAADRAAIGRLCRAAILQGQGRILAAETLAGTMEAAVFVVRDAQTAYCVLAAFPKASNAAAVNLLLWEAMQDAAAHGLTIDFSGVSNAGNAVLLAGLGGQVVPRYVVSRFSRGYKLARRLRHPFGGWVK